MKSPNGALQISVQNNKNGKLTYEVRRQGRPVIASSAMGIVVDGVDLAEGAEIGRVERYRINETYPWNGAHSKAVNNCNGARISMQPEQGKKPFTLDVRVFNDGVAFRYIVAGSDRPQVPDEATSFRIPAGSTVWYHGIRGHYEGVYARKAISELSAGEWAASPLTFELPNGGGYGSITEGALTNYAGMGLQTDGQLGFAARLAHAQPASYPFTLRYGEEEAKRLSQPAAIAGVIQTPWRVITAVADLNALVNSDILANVSEPPGPKFFPKGIATEWVKPGRAVWRYLDGGENTIEELKNFSRLAGELGFEYHVVEGVWRRWTDEELRDFVEYSNKHNVRVIVWVFSKNLRDPDQRRSLFSKLHSMGVAGLKIDFFDHEAKEMMDLYDACLRDAAEFQLVLELHGCNKPTGENRTWPNELTKEGVYGLEHRSMASWGEHNATLPFTRLTAGPADYTPMIFGERRKETSWPHQIASAALLSSPLTIIAANPKNILENPAVELIKAIPSTWDETIVLPVSRIGEVAAFARRKGDRWFIAIMNGPKARTVKVDLRFLGGGNYKATLVRDKMDDPSAEKIDSTTVTRKDSLEIELRAGGGFIGAFSTKAGS
ncbi:MAG TPA: glycoside hydrolase family 97 N-terminal domain-containing protein [Clostridia bacterium]|nr:glycoside hydrolase family 97 N-terminal domain-containing protein [Clostridia bacterium]